MLCRRSINVKNYEICAKDFQTFHSIAGARRSQPALGLRDAGNHLCASTSNLGSRSLTRAPTGTSSRRRAWPGNSYSEDWLHSADRLRRRNAWNVNAAGACDGQSTSAVWAARAWTITRRRAARIIRSRSGPSSAAASVVSTRSSAARSAALTSCPRAQARRARRTARRGSSVSARAVDVRPLWFISSGVAGGAVVLIKVRGPSGIRATNRTAAHGLIISIMRIPVNFAIHTRICHTQVRERCL